MRHLAACLVTLFALLPVAGPTAAQPFPVKPIRVVVPYPVGGAVDVMTRIVTNHMAGTLGQSIIIENRPGANANLGPDHVSKSPADGYTVLASATFLIANPLVETTLRWSPQELVPVARFTTAPNVFVVPAAAPYSNLSEFVAAAKAKPGMTFGESGPGAPQTMAGEMFKTRAGIELRSVLYKGGPPALADLVAGVIDTSVLPLNVAAAAISGARVKALASTSNARSPLIPDVPTMAESGYGDATVVSWYGFHVPAGTPAEVIARLSAAVAAATSHDEVRSRTANVGGEISFLDTGAFTQFLRDDQVRWERFVRLLKR